MTQLEILKEDVQVAVERGVLSESQATQLRALAEHRQGLRANLAADDEPFEFFRGMNEIFISIGLVLAISGSYTLVPFLSILLVWPLAEYFVRKRKMVLPGIVLSGSYAISAIWLMALVDEIYSDVAMVNSPTDFLVKSVLVMALCALFYRRFRVPFALVPLAAAVLCSLLALVSLLVPDAAFLYDKDAWEAMFNAGYAPSLAFTTLAFGLGCFAVAMRFDLRDPHRVTRYAACGFWLHLAAAPAIVNTLAYTVYNLDSQLGMLMLALVILLITVISLVIDRRSFLLSGCTYLGLLLYKAAEFMKDGPIPASLTLLAVGSLMLVVGAKWSLLRQWVMVGLPHFKYKDRLPPYKVAL